VTDFAAVLWDLDGTLVDTEPLWMGAEHELAEAYGRVWTTEDSLELVGSALLPAGSIIRDKLDLPLTPGEIVDHLIERVVAGLAHEVPWQPGAVELIEALEAEGVPQALVTMSWAVIADPIAAVLPFGAVITGDAVPRGKPHPDPYLLAAERLDVDPTACLAIEDSSTGAASASAAGCYVLGVPHAVPVPPGPRRTILPTLADLTPADLRALTFWA